MLTVDVKNMESIFGKMKQAELAIGGYYKACYQMDIPENKLFWNALSETETKHAGNMDKILLLIKKNPSKYYNGFDLDPANINDIISQAKEAASKVSKLQIMAKGMLLAAKGLEDRLLEKKYIETVKSEELEFIKVLNEMKDETIAHREMIMKKLEGLS